MCEVLHSDGPLFQSAMNRGPSTTSPAEVEDFAGPIYATWGRPPAKLSRLFSRSPHPPHIDNSRRGVPMQGIVIDTNVFVAAGFNPRSASARILADIRRGRFLLIWNKPTQRETEVISPTSSPAIARTASWRVGNKSILYSL